MLLLFIVNADMFKKNINLINVINEKKMVY